MYFQRLQCKNKKVLDYQPQSKKEEYNAQKNLIETMAKGSIRNVGLHYGQGS